VQLYELLLTLQDYDVWNLGMPLCFRPKVKPPVLQVLPLNFQNLALVSTQLILHLGWLNKERAVPNFPGEDDKRRKLMFPVNTRLIKIQFIVLYGFWITRPRRTKSLTAKPYHKWRFSCASLTATRRKWLYIMSRVNGQCVNGGQKLNSYCAAFCSKAI